MYIYHIYFFFRDEIDQVKVKKSSYNFKYYLLISKSFCALETKSKKNKGKGSKPLALDAMYSNAEEEFFQRVSN